MPSRLEGNLARQTPAEKPSRSEKIPKKLRGTAENEPSPSTVDVKALRGAFETLAKDVKTRGVVDLDIDRMPYRVREVFNSTVEEMTEDPNFEPAELAFALETKMRDLAKTDAIDAAIVAFELEQWMKEISKPMKVEVEDESTAKLRSKTRQALGVKTRKILQQQPKSLDDLEIVLPDVEEPENAAQTKPKAKTRITYGDKAGRVLQQQPKSLDELQIVLPEIPVEKSQKNKKEVTEKLHHPLSKEIARNWATFSEEPSKAHEIMQDWMDNIANVTEGLSLPEQIDAAIDAAMQKNKADAEKGLRTISTTLRKQRTRPTRPQEDAEVMDALTEAPYEKMSSDHPIRMEDASNYDALAHHLGQMKEGAVLADIPDAYATDRRTIKKILKLQKAERDSVLSDIYEKAAAYRKKTTSEVPTFKEFGISEDDVDRIAYMRSMLSSGGKRVEPPMGYLEEIVRDKNPNAKAKEFATALRAERERFDARMAENEKVERDVQDRLKDAPTAVRREFEMQIAQRMRKYTEAKNAAEQRTSKKDFTPGPPSERAESAEISTEEIKAVRPTKNEQQEARVQINIPRPPASERVENNEKRVQIAEDDQRKVEALQKELAFKSIADTFERKQKLAGSLREDLIHELEQTNGVQEKLLRYRGHLNDLYNDVERLHIQLKKDHSGPQADRLAQEQARTLEVVQRLIHATNENPARALETIRDLVPIKDERVESTSAKLRQDIQDRYGESPEALLHEKASGFKGWFNRIRFRMSGADKKWDIADRSARFSELVERYQSNPREVVSVFPNAATIWSRLVEKSGGSQMAGAENAKLGSDIQEMITKFALSRRATEMGFPDQAAAYAQQAIDISKKRNIPGTELTEMMK